MNEPNKQKIYWNYSLEQLMVIYGSNGFYPRLGQNILNFGL